jgi:hypothetical protein
MIVNLINFKLFGEQMYWHRDMLVLWQNLSHYLLYPKINMYLFVHLPKYTIFLYQDSEMRHNVVTSQNAQNIEHVPFMHIYEGRSGGKFIRRIFMFRLTCKILLYAVLI